MTVLSRGARVRRGGRRPGWVLLTALLVLAIGASSALVFTNRVELLKLAVILALWAAVAGAFVSVLYRRQSDADQSRVRDLKLVYDLQLDREISARREYELTVESQLRRELASEIRAAAADDLAALRAEVASLRTSLEILFDTDLEQRPALETMETDTPPARAYSDWDRNGEGAGADWVTSDRVTSVRDPISSSEPRTDESAIIDVPEEPLLPPRSRERSRFQYEGQQYEGQQEASWPPPQQVPYPEAPSYPPPHEVPYPPSPMPAAAEAEHRFQPAPWQSQPQPVAPPPPEPQPGSMRPDWQPVNAEGLWLPPGTAGSNWVQADSPQAPVAAPSGRRRRRHADPEEQFDAPPAENEPPEPPGESGRRARSRHSAEYRDYSVRNFISPNEPGPAPPPAAATAPPPHPRPAPHDAASPPRLAPGPHLEPAPRHLGAEEGLDTAAEGPQTGGQSVADLLARLQVQPSGSGRRRRRDG